MVCSFASELRGERPVTDLPPERKATITYETHVLTGPRITPSPFDPMVEATVAQVFSETHAFNVAIPALDGMTRTHLGIFFGLVPESRAVSVVTQVLAGLTLYVFPHYQSYKLRFHVDVIENGRLKKSYEGERQVANWIELFMTVAAPFNAPGTALREAGEDLLLGFLADVQKDRVIRADGEPDEVPAPSPYAVDSAGPNGITVPADAQRPR
jgi:hypothetical protein